MGGGGGEGGQLLLNICDVIYSLPTNRFERIEGSTNIEVYYMCDVIFELAIQFVLFRTAFLNRRDVKDFYRVVGLIFSKK